jgi:hypothetical protein
MAAIRIRFVTSKGVFSSLIRLQAGVSMPFTPSHTEALTQDGKFYIGAQNSGIRQEPVGYDAKTMLHEKIVELPCTPQQEADFYKFVHSKIGLPYDWAAIEGFVAPGFNLHTAFHEICSAFMCWGIRKVNYFPWPMTVPFHHISPRDLFLTLSTHVEINH